MYMYNKTSPYKENSVSLFIHIGVQNSGWFVFLFSILDIAQLMANYG